MERKIDMKLAVWVERLGWEEKGQGHLNQFHKLVSAQTKKLPDYS